MNDTVIDEEKMPLTDHLEELRTRLIRVLIVLCVGFVLCFFFKERIFGIIMYPLEGVMPGEGSMIFTSLPEAFFTYLKVSFFAAIFLTSPYSLYQVWKFVSPGLYSSEKKYIVPFVVISSLFFIGGALFAYFLVFPLGFAFFLTFTTEFIRPMISMREYLGFTMKLLIAFAVVFELPIFMYFLARVGIVNSAILKKRRKYAILVSFIVGALLTPPDVVTQLLLAIPIIMLYELSIWVIKKGEKKVSEEVRDGAGDSGT
ncbi:MAG: twin-arginine translocase subunit TatC [Syntrophales bacterium]|jgi:sec-independent protein translocase protein TatC|nr:twin-arginine translocase subunit TatC [Syntrophales bacterium]MCK9527904.1 twin-arginine translocase subunit TatC [Syntrophales bacterium]MDX9921920.1 twin-arginine translocase subunit TatC [Syntrophales bacterium]